MTDPFAADQELQDYIAAQTKEYSTWVATRDIRVGNALAYRVGDPVPASNVDAKGRVIVNRHFCGDHDPCDRVGEPTGWTDPDAVRKVAKTSSKAGKAAKGEET